MQLRKILCLAFISFLPLNSFSQESIPLKPGSKLIDGGFIKAYTNKWKVVVISPDGTTLQALIWTDYVQQMELNGKIYLHRVQDLYSPDYSLVDSWVNMVEQKTLIPWQFQAVNPSGFFTSLEFTQKSVVSNSNRNQDRVLKMDTLDIQERVFDWNLYGMLLVALPFEIGKSYELPVWLPGANQEGTVLASIEGIETITTLSEKKIKTYKISTDKGLTFWLTKKAPYVIQLQLNQPNGARRMWYIF